MNQSKPYHDPLRPHAHESNPDPPTNDPDFTLLMPDGTSLKLKPADLRELPLTSLPGCYIISTGHGTSGPFTFQGVTLLTLIRHHWQKAFSQVELISADGFGNRILAEELLQPDPAGPMVLAYAIDDQPMTRQQGLVRLIVPSERDDALRQVKWISRINVLAASLPSSRLTAAK